MAAQASLAFETAGPVTLAGLAVLSAVGASAAELPCDAELSAFDEASRVLSGAFFGDDPASGGFRDSIEEIGRSYGPSPQEIAWRDREAVLQDWHMVTRYLMDPQFATPDKALMDTYLVSAADYMRCRRADLGELSDERQDALEYGDTALAQFADIHYGIDLDLGSRK